jgi:hypothetical protein
VMVILSLYMKLVFDGCEPVDRVLDFELGLTHPYKIVLYRERAYHLYDPSMNE